MKHHPTKLLYRMAVAAAALLVSSAMVAGAETPLTDIEITRAVDDHLMEDVATPAGFIDLSTAEGIVTLEGSVSHILARERAEKIAETVKGVRGVVNMITVAPPYRTDVEIREEVENALLANPATDSWQVAAKVDDAVVTLTGTVDSWQEKQLAGTVAKGVYGVRDLRNELDIDYGQARTDAEIRDEVAQTLLWDSRVDSALIDVSVEDGRVSLSGIVGSAAERRIAGADAWVDGTESVDTSGLEVRWWARDDRLRRDKYVERSEAEIVEAVQDTFLYDPRVNLYDIQVAAEAGRVTLRGEVEYLEAKRAAAEDARNVVGVWSVNNKIKVRPNTPSDGTIESRVENAILWDPYVERYDVDVSVVNGEVYLYGDVDSTFERARADYLAARQAGVVEVHNYLDVHNDANLVYDYEPYIDDWFIYDYGWYTPRLEATVRTDWEIEEDINDQMFWSPFVNADQVYVEVDDGVATLTGTVDTWNERQAATENAYEGGAIAVDNDLLVEYGPDYYNVP